MDKELVKQSVEMFLKGMDLSGNGFYQTPERVTRMWEEIFSVEPPSPMVCPMEGQVDMIMLRHHIFWSFCPHHLLPVKYEISLAYIPATNNVLGASKPLRISDWAVKGFPLQEEIPSKILKGIEESLRLLGFGCIIKGEHLCMRMRGVKSPCSDMITPLLVGIMREPLYASTFFNCINSK